MKRLLRKEILICAILLAACDSNEPTDEGSFAGSYINKPTSVFGQLELRPPEVATSDFLYAGTLLPGSIGTQLQCSGNETVLTCIEAPVRFSYDSYTLTKTMEGLDMSGASEIEFILDESGDGM